MFGCEINKKMEIHQNKILLQTHFNLDSNGKQLKQDNITGVLLHVTLLSIAINLVAGKAWMFCCFYQCTGKIPTLDSIDT